MKRWMMRCLAGLALALVFALPALAQSQDASGPAVAGPTPDVSDCQSCHESFDAAWQSGGHGPDATAGFQTVWEKQGQPQACLSCHTLEGMQCQSCHSPVFAEHPLSPGSVNRGSKTCGECHAATLVGWQVSQHGQGDMTCVDCHDPHAAGVNMKGGEVSTLCANCHKDSDSNFAHEAHLSIADLACTDCHATHAGDAVEPHTMVDHSFDVKVATCNACHAVEALDVEPQAAAGPAPVDAMASALDVQASNTPTPLSPWSLVTGAVAVGFGAGAVTPWLRRKLEQRNGGSQPRDPWAK